MKYVFIVNPSSGSGRAKEVATKLEDVCKKENMDYVIRLTNKPKEATKIALEYKRDNCIIYAVGGDGTLNEVLNGIVGTKNKLGIIPCGSGNDFYKSISKLKEEELTIDVGKINDRYFINIASIGIDAEVANNVSIMKKRKIPCSQVYNASILYTFFTFKFKDLSFILNKTKKKAKYTLIAICNGTYYGSGFKIAPYADLSDGLFDIYFVDKISKLKIPKLLGKLKKGTHGESPDIHRRRANKITLISKEKIICNIDGEIIVDKKFKIELLSKKLIIFNDYSFIKKIMNK